MGWVKPQKKSLPDRGAISFVSMDVEEGLWMLVAFDYLAFFSVEVDFSVQQYGNHRNVFVVNTFRNIDVF